MIKRYIKKIIPQMVLNPIYLCQERLDRGITETTSNLNVQGNLNWLDVGCGDKPYAKLFSKHRYTGIHVQKSGRSDELKTADLYYDGTTIPLRKTLLTTSFALKL